MTKKKLDPWRQRAVDYHLRCAEHFRRSARSGHIPEETIQKLLAQAADFERKAEYYSKRK